MSNGRYHALVNVLDQLGSLLNTSACLIIDERGLLVSEYTASDIDKNAMAVMSSLLNGTSNRFINSLNLNKLNSLVLNTSKGIFLIKDIFIPNQNRKFTFSIFIEKEKLQGKKYSKFSRKGFKDYFLRIFGAQRIRTNGFKKHLLRKVDETIFEIQEIFKK